jgi:hypothetical protein
LDLSGSEYGAVAGSCEHGNKSLGFVKDAAFLDLLSVLLTCQDGPCSKELVNDYSSSLWFLLQIKGPQSKSMLRAWQPVSGENR